MMYQQSQRPISAVTGSSKDHAWISCSHVLCDNFDFAKNDLWHMLNILRQLEFVHLHVYPSFMLALFFHSIIVPREMHEALLARSPLLFKKSI